MADQTHPVIDFHAHLRGNAPISNLEVRGNPFYFKELADLMEPMTRQVAHLCGTQFRDPFSRFLYRSINHYAYQEIVRVFEKYTVDALLDSMTRNGIAHTVVCPIEPLFKSADVAAAIAPFPKRLSFFAGVDPYNESAVSELEGLLRDYSVAGLKLNPARAGSTGEKRRMWELLGLAQDHDLPVFLHSGTFPFEPHGGSLEDLAALVAGFQHLSITIAHMGWDSYAAILDLAERYHHVSVETSWQPPRVARLAVDRLGAHRVLMGSDFPLLQQSVSIENMNQVLSPSEFRLVAYKNAQRLLGLPV